MLSTTNIQFQYDQNTHFDFPDLHCDAGNILLITGQSGCGKTTLLHLLAGILRAPKGSIEIGGTNIAALTAAQCDHFRGQKIGLVFQKTHFIAALSVLDNLRLPLWLGQHSATVQDIQKIAERLGIGHTLRKNPAQLSIGEQQRVSIARAVIHQPALLLADEPTSALDDTNCQEVLAILKEMAREQGAALVIVTHDSRLKTQIDHQINLMESHVL